jgi:uncharacterized short protein YbdD (DUF466 family)
VTAPRWAQALLWSLRELAGEAEYEGYCAGHQRHHPLAPVPSRRDYQALRAHRAESAPRRGRAHAGAVL